MNEGSVDQTRLMLQAMPATIVAPVASTIIRRSQRCYGIGPGGVRLCKEEEGECGYCHIENCPIWREKYSGL